MTKIIMHGCNGKMGQTIRSLLEQDDEAYIVAGVDPREGISNPYPVFKNINDCNIDADVIIDFASASAVDGLLDYCVRRGMPCVLCTTGLSEAQLERVRKVSESTAILKSANMSMGINLLLKVIKDIAAVLAPAGFDMEIVEKHHNQKLDAPSGTALALADAINGAGEYEYVYDRSKERHKREQNEIGISAVRGGTIVGDHDVIFAGIDEVVTVSHMAYSKAVFGKGAVQAAKYMKGRTKGLYDMSDVINGNR